MIAAVSRFLCGYLEVLLCGKYPGRFFNLCARNGICLWNITQTNKKQYRFSIGLSDFWKLRPLCRKTHVRLLIQKRHGIWFPIKKYHRRVCFLASFFAVFGLLWILSDHVWKIAISGNSYLSEAVLTDYLAENGWGYGTRKEAIDCTALELSLRTDFPEIIWASSYLKGTMLVVEIQENLMTDTADRPEAEEGVIVNIEAANDAVITSIITRSGTALVKAGDSVSAGDLLVLGTEEIIDDDGNTASVLTLPADADILGSVSYEYSDVIPLQDTVYTDTGESSRCYFLSVLGHTIYVPYKDPGYEQAQSFSKYRQLCILDHFYLPVFWGSKEWMAQTKTTRILDADAAKETALSHLNHFLSELEENGVSITGKNVIMKKEEDFYSVSGTVEGTTNIGVYVRQEVTESSEEGRITDEYE
jgi:similar to stage IV sporulation protein